MHSSQPQAKPILLEKISSLFSLTVLNKVYFANSLYNFTLQAYSITGVHVLLANKQEKTVLWTTYYCIHELILLFQQDGYN